MNVSTFHQENTPENRHNSAKCTLKHAKFKFISQHVTKQTPLNFLTLDHKDGGQKKSSWQAQFFYSILAKTKQNNK